MPGPPRQCPRCELLFEGEPELEDHLRTDHGLGGALDDVENMRESPGQPGGT